MKWIKTILMIMQTSVHIMGKAQNLVPNPSFEEYSECPTDINTGSIFGGNYFPVIAWTVPTAGSPDYFNVCGAFDVSVPNNFWGTQTAFSGNGYVGIYPCGFGSNYKEYIQVPLTQTLVAGQKYYVSFYVNLADWSNSAIKEIGAYFSAAAISSQTNTTLSYTPQIQFSDRCNYRHR